MANLQTEYIGVRVTREDRRLLDEIARREDRTLSSIFRTAIRERAQRLGLIEPQPQPERPAA